MQSINIPRLADGQRATVALRRECEPDSRTRCVSWFKPNVASTERKSPALSCGTFGGNNWARTSDPLHVKQVL